MYVFIILFGFLRGVGWGGGGNLLMWILMFIYLCVVKKYLEKMFCRGGVIDKYLLVYLIVVCLVGEK